MTCHERLTKAERDLQPQLEEDHRFPKGMPPLLLLMCCCSKPTTVLLYLPSPFTEAPAAPTQPAPLPGAERIPSSLRHLGLLFPGTQSCPTLALIQGHAGHWGPEQPGTAGGAPAQGRGWNQMSPKVPPTQTSLGFDASTAMDKAPAACSGHGRWSECSPELPSHPARLGLVCVSQPSGAAHPGTPNLSRLHLHSRGEKVTQATPGHAKEGLKVSIPTAQQGVPWLVKICLS